MMPRGFAAVRSDILLYRQYVSENIRNLAEIEELIRSGIVVLIPELQWLQNAQHKIFTALRRDMSDSTITNAIDLLRMDAFTAPSQRNDLRGMTASASGVKPTAATHRLQYQSELYYLHKSMSLSRVSGAVYTPDSPGDWDLFAARAEAEIQTLPVEAKFLRQLSQVDLPGLPLTPATAQDIRQNYDEFAEWRRTVRDLRRSLDPSSTPTQVQEQLNDALLSKAHAIRKTTQSGSLSSIGKSTLPALITEFVFWHITGQVGAGAVTAALELLGRLSGRKGENQGVIDVLSRSRG